MAVTMTSNSGTTVWVLLVLCKLAAHVSQAMDCPYSMFSSSYQCKDPALGSYTTELFSLPCCYDDDKDVLYALFTRDNRHDKQDIRRSDPLPPGFSRRQGTVFIIHGWQSAYNVESFVQMKDALLDKADYNIVMVDWPSDRYFYAPSASETRPVGALSGRVMEMLVKEGGVRYSDIWCVGHSLGAHVCGYAGRSTRQPIARITGLDPAGPWFEDKKLSVGLNSADARFVDIIHTDTAGTFGFIGKYGTVRAMGHMDFYVNGRETQPHCMDKRKRRKRALFSDYPGCSHTRAVTLFVESVAAGDCFISRQKCTDVDDMPGSCAPCGGAADGVCAVMGYGAPGSGQDGMYLVETAENFPPHCKG